MEEKIFDTENSIVVKISNAGAETLIDEDCCTCINIILKNDGRIATSFLGCHNKYILKELTKAQKKYFKSLKKTLKEQVKKATPTTEYKSDDVNENKEHVCEDEKCLKCEETKETKQETPKKENSKKQTTKKSTTKKTSTTKENKKIENK